MKYKVVKEFSILEKGDILEDVKENGINTIRIDKIDNNNKHLSVIYDEDYIQYLLEIGNIVEVTETSNAIDLINNLLEMYEDNIEEVEEKASRGEIQPCVKLEAETVYYNLNKVLNKIKDTLTNE